MSRQTDGPLIIAVLLLAITGLIGSVVDVIHDREAEEWGTHCATLDAIAVQTPEGWTCITTAVIPADSGPESVTGGRESVTES